MESGFLLAEMYSRELLANGVSILVLMESGFLLVLVGILLGGTKFLSLF